MSWGGNNEQFVVLNDGSGWLEPPTRFFKRSLWIIKGLPGSLTVSNSDGYPNVDVSQESEDAPHYHGHGILAIDGKIYQFLSSLDNADDRPKHWNAAKLIFSPDGGKTWCNQDGSHPVHWETLEEQTAEKLTFFEEPDRCFSLVTILQMGQDYRLNKDGYVYVYGPNGNVDGLMNQLVMFRVPKHQLLNRQSYEYYGGLGANGSPQWRKDINLRQPVHVFPKGWVNHTNLFPGDIVVETWLPSIVYNKALDLYMMASAGTGCAPDGTEFAKPGYFGFWISQTPWGPWRQIHEDTAWTPDGDPKSRAYSPQIAPKWISEDGKSFWLVWADLQNIREFVSGMNEPAPEAESTSEVVSPEQAAIETSNMMREGMPKLRFNAQRMDFEFT